MGFFVLDAVEKQVPNKSQPSMSKVEDATKHWPLFNFQHFAFLHNISQAFWILKHTTQEHLSYVPPALFDHKTGKGI